MARVCKVSMMWRDTAGAEARTQVSLPIATLPTDPVIGQIIEAVGGGSAAGITRVTITYVLDEGTDETGGAYGVEDQAVLTFSTTLGRMAQVSVPAPVSTMFEPDDKTVDPESDAASAIISRALTSLTGPSGEALDEYVSGYRVRTGYRPAQGAASKSEN